VQHVVDSERFELQYRPRQAGPLHLGRRGEWQLVEGSFGVEAVAAAGPSATGAAGALPGRGLAHGGLGGGGDKRCRERRGERMR
jgi:hypothetical protein